jgi:hypothetical protein
LAAGNEPASSDFFSILVKMSGFCSRLLLCKAIRQSSLFSIEDSFSQSILSFSQLIAQMSKIGRKEKQ